MKIGKIFAQVLFAVMAIFSGATQAIPVCEDKTLIVYTNGIFTTRSEASDASLALENKYRQYHSLQSSTKPLGYRPFYGEHAPMEFKLAYVADQNASNTSLAYEFYAVAKQKLGMSLSNIWRQMSEIEAMSPEVRQSYESFSILASVIVVNDADLQAHLNTIYYPALNRGHRIVTVAHSQGNFYANAAYDAIQHPIWTGQYGGKGNSTWGSMMGIVAVASPASFISTKRSSTNFNQQVTAWEDFAINGIRLVSSLLAQPLRPTVSNYGDLSLKKWKSVNGGHGFTGYYLAGKYSRDLIMYRIYNEIWGLYLHANRRLYRTIEERITGDQNIINDGEGPIFYKSFDGGPYESPYFTGAGYTLACPTDTSKGVKRITPQTLSYKFMDFGPTRTQWVGVLVFNIGGVEKPFVSVLPHFGQRSADAVTFTFTKNPGSYTGYDVAF